MPNHRYALTTRPDIECWLEALLGSHAWRREPASNHSETFLDTFDWRLYRNRQCLTWSETEEGNALCCVTHEGTAMAKADADASPGFLEDLPPGALRDHLQPTIKMRRLLSQATLHSKQSNLALLNGSGKTVLRLQIDTDRVAEIPGGDRHPLPPQISLLPIKGYRSALKDLAKRLANDPDLEPVGHTPLEECLLAAGRRVGDYSSKLELQLDPEQPAVHTLRIILQILQQVMEVNLDGLHGDIDTEFLHDFRVAIRRTRSALGQLKGLLADDEVAPFKESFAWLGGLTGPTRDLDVYQLKFESYRKLLPEACRNDLDPFRKFLLQRRNREFKRMCTALKSRRFTSLMKTWRDFLERAPQPNPALPDASRPTAEIAARRIRKLFKRCLREGGAITPDSPAEALHEMRKTCKKLRYLLEFFRSLYPEAAMGVLIKALKGLQDNLGDIQDYEVQSDAIRAFALEMADKDLAPPETLLAMGMLSEKLTRQQHRAREEFHRRFSEFSAAENRRLFRDLCGPTHRQGGTVS